MKWIKLTHSSGVKYINLETVYTIDGNSSPTDITFYDSSSVMPISYTFATAQEKDEAMSKLSAIISSIDIDLLSPQ